jgi:hypothetical protein
MSTIARVVCRLRAKDRLETAPHRFVERGALREALGPAEDGRQRIVQLVRHAGDGLS